MTPLGPNPPRLITVCESLVQKTADIFYSVKPYFILSLGSESPSKPIFSHPYFSLRSIVGRRFFFIIGTLYLYRCITMYVTTLPVPGMHFQCAPKVSPSELPFRGR